MIELPFTMTPVSLSSMASMPEVLAKSNVMVPSADSRMFDIAHSTGTCDPDDLHTAAGLVDAENDPL